jgi:CheY-like chemotaxis protein
MQLNEMKILLVEDDDFNRRLVLELLSDSGTTIDVANNGIEAVSLALSDKHYDIILMDLQMPDMGGIEATHQIRAHLKDIPIIAMTASIMNEDKQQCSQAGMNDIIFKPINLEDLYSIFEQFVKLNPEKSKPQKLETTKAESDFPDELPPFDLPKALGRVFGNKDFLKELIVNFYNKYNDVIAELKNANLEISKRLAHNLKGIAGTLEISTLYNAAHNFEQALRNNQPNDIPNLFSELESALNSALNASLIFINNELNIQVSFKPIDFPKVKELIKELRSQLDTNNMKAKKDLLQLKEELLSHKSTLEILSLLEKQIGVLDFEKAMQTLTNLEKIILTEDH